LQKIIIIIITKIPVEEEIVVESHASIGSLEESMGIGGASGSVRRRVKER
jgi:hypothetical protein